MKNLSALIKSFDNFGDTIGFEINGSRTFTTWPGHLITAIIYTLICIYGHQKFTVLYEYGDTQHETLQSERNIDEVLSAEEVNFDFAFKLVKYNRTTN